jgi:hypothetical protein
MVLCGANKQWGSPHAIFYFQLSLMRVHAALKTLESLVLCMAANSFPNHKLRLEQGKAEMQQ